MRQQLDDESCVLIMFMRLCFDAQGQVYGKPVNQGITQLKPTRNLRNVAEERAGRKIGGLRILNSYWVNEVRQGSRRFVGPSVGGVVHGTHVHAAAALICLGLSLRICNSSSGILTD